MFEITKMGVCYAAVGAVYMLTVGRNLLPNREVFSALLAPADNREFLTQAIIAPGSPLVGQRFPKTNLLKITEMITNNAAAILLSPVVIQIADDLGVNARPFLVAVMFGASASFATPIGYQTNTYVYGAGGYRFSDFVRVGLPLNIIVWLAAKILIPLMWPFN
jgi:di/tricarboxylate transporter